MQTQLDAVPMLRVATVVASACEQNHTRRSDGEHDDASEVVATLDAPRRVGGVNAHHSASVLITADKAAARTPPRRAAATHPNDKENAWPVRVEVVDRRKHRRDDTRQADPQEPVPETPVRSLLRFAGSRHELEVSAVL